MAEAEEIQKILNIRVNYQEAVKGIEEYNRKIAEAKKYQDELNERLEAGEVSADEYAEGMATAQNAVKEYNSEIRTLNKEIQNNIKEQESQDGSLKQMRAQLSQMTKAYSEMSREQRDNSDAGKQLTQNIVKLTNDIKKAEEAIGDYRRSVGSYEKAIGATLGTQSQWFQKAEQLATLMQFGLTNALKTTGQAVAGVGKQFLALLANPIVAILAAIAGAFTVLYNALKSNEEGTRALERVMAPLEGLLKVIINAVQSLAQVIIEAVEGMGSLTMWLTKMAERLPGVGNLFGQVNAALEENIALTKAKQALEDAERQTELDNAEAARDVAKLRAEAAELSDPQARAAKLKAALALEGEQLERQLKIARERFSLAEREAAQTANSTADNEKLVKAREEVLKAEESYYSGTLRIRSNIRSADEEIAREAAANAKARAAAAKQAAAEREAAEKDAAAKQLAAARQLEDALISIIQDNYEKQAAQVQAQYDRRIADLQAYLATEKNLTEQAVADINATIVVLYQQRADELARIEREGSAERLNQAIADEQARLQLIIDTTRKGSEEQYNARMALIQQQQDAATAEIENASLTEQQKQERIDLVRQQFEQQRTDLRVEQNNMEMQAAQDAFNARLEQETGNALLQAQTELEQRKAALDALHQMEGESDDAFHARQLKAQEAYNKAKEKLVKAENQITQGRLQVASAVFGGMSDIMSAFGEESKEAAIASKVLALGQIAVSTGLALAQGVQQAQSQPFPGNIAAIATTVGTILANIASAIKTVKSAQFADGGLVDGGAVSGAGTSKSDSIPARLSNGESVMTAEATSMFAPLLSTLNQIGGGVPIMPAQTVYTQPAGEGGEGMDMFKDAMAEALREMPQPVVSVEEINNVNDRVEVIEALALQ